MENWFDDSDFENEQEMTDADASAQEESLSDETIRSAIEALLFTMGTPVSVDAMAAAIGISREETLEAAGFLREEYENKDRGIRLIELDGSFQMCSSPQMYKYINALTHQPKKYVLTDVMLETLAIIAYRQPITRSEIEKIRGVNCSYPVNRLLEFGLIMEAGRLDAPGRPILFATTEEFLRAFGVSSPSQLPALSDEEMASLQREADEESVRKDTL